MKITMQAPDPLYAAMRCDECEEEEFLRATTVVEEDGFAPDPIGMFCSRECVEANIKRTF